MLPLPHRDCSCLFSWFPTTSPSSQSASAATCSEPSMHPEREEPSTLCDAANLLSWSRPGPTHSTHNPSIWPCQVMESTKLPDHQIHRLCWSQHADTRFAVKDLATEFQHTFDSDSSEIGSVLRHMHMNSAVDSVEAQRQEDLTGSSVL